MQHHKVSICQRYVAGWKAATVVRVFQRKFDYPCSTLDSPSNCVARHRYMNEHVVFSTPGMSAHDVYAACGAIAKSLLHDAAPPAWKDGNALLQVCSPH